MLASDPAAYFAALPETLAAPLRALRATILEVGNDIPEAGGIIETLKWGEPAYLPRRAGVGTTVRIGTVRNTAERYALYVNCQTSLVANFALLYPGRFEFGGTRALIFDTAAAVPQGELRHCVALALTYHRWKPGPA